MSQLSLFPELEIIESPTDSVCHHEEKVSVGRGKGFDLMQCVDCGELFYAVYKWDGTEHGAYTAVYSHPLPDGVADDDRLRRFLRCLSDARWKTNEQGLVTQHGGKADFLEAYKSFDHGVLLPF